MGTELSTEKFRWYFLSSWLCVMHIKVTFISAPCAACLVVTNEALYCCCSISAICCQRVNLRLIQPICCFCFMQMFKVPLLCVMKGSYFGFGSPQQQVDMHARSKNTLSYNMHLFLSYLLNDSQTIRSTIHFSKPLCVTLICGDWSNWSHFHFIMPVMPDKAVLLCVQRYRGKPLFYAPKAAPSGKEWICIFIQTKAKRPSGQTSTWTAWDSF